MKVYFAGDHAGFEMKKELMAFARSLGHEVEDMGPFEPKAGDDYPDYVIPLAKRVAKAQMNADTEGADGRRLRPQIDADGKGQRESAVRGIVVAGSGQGEIIAMNRVKGARAALLCPCHRTQINADAKTQINADNNDADVRRCSISAELIKVSRDHNDSNIFAIGARFCSLDEAKKGITVWLETPFSGEERHIRRLAKIENLAGGA